MNARDLEDFTQSLHRRFPHLSIEAIRAEVRWMLIRYARALGVGEKAIDAYLATLRNV